MRRLGWKYVWNGAFDALFDVGRDPAERTNLFAAHIGLGRIVALCYRSSASYQIH